MTLVRGFNITRIHDSQTGGNVLSVEANPSLPQGLVFSSLTNSVSIEGTQQPLRHGQIIRYEGTPVRSNSKHHFDANVHHDRDGNNTLVL